MKGYVKRALAVLLIAGLCLSLFSCSGSKTSSLSIGSADVITPQAASDSVHTVKSYLTSAAESEFLRLSVDEASTAVCVTDTTTGKEWKSLPDDDNSTAYLFGVRLYTESGVYYLNTQDSAVYFSTADTQIGDSQITVNYALSDKKETAAKAFSSIVSGDIYVSFQVVYTLDDQVLSVSVDCSSVKCAPDSFVGSISFLPWFGSEKETGSDDYIFIPDGSGAVMNLSNDDEATANVSVAVYGNNPNNDDVSTAVSYIPVYGVKSSDGAFCAIAADGDALSTIKASRPTDTEQFKAGFEFSITDTITSDDGKSVYFGNSYDGKIQVDYKFLSGDSANYIGMANAARESFIEMGYLSSSKLENEGNTPFCLTVVGDFEGKTLAGATQTQDMLTVLKGKGINDITLTYKGLLSGGLNQNSLYSAKINSNLGGSDDVEALYDYVRKQNYEMYVNVNIFSSKSGFSASKMAKGADGQKLCASLTNDLAAVEPTNDRLSSRITKEVADAGKDNPNASLYSGDASYQFSLLKLSQLSDSFSSFLSGSLTRMSDGFLLGDAGSVLYSDGDYDRQRAKEIISAQANAVSAYSYLAVDSGNIYVLRNAKLVSSTKFNTYYTESGAYEPIPFLQSVLHGYVRYTGKPIDAASQLYRFDMLQCIEYGAAPSFEWVFDDSSIFYYGYYVLSDKISEIVDFYEKANEMFSGLEGETITNHRKITESATGEAQSGVYMTEYSNGTRIYVNYTGSVVTTSGNIVIEPYDCVRVDRTTER